MARSKKTAKKSSGKIALNFKGVQTRTMLPENDYHLKITGIEEEDDAVKVKLEVIEGKHEGKSVTEYFNTGEKALWRLGNFLLACGLTVPDDELELDIDDFEDVTVMGVCTHDEYDGKQRMRWDFYPADDDSEDEDKDDEKETKSSKKSSGKKSKKDEPETLDRDDIEALDDRDDIEALISEHDLDIDPEEKKYKKDAKLLEAVIEALDEKGLFGDGEDAAEEEKETKSSKKDKKGGKKKKGADKVASSDVEDMDEDALGELVSEHELDVDLDDFKTLRKKVRAVLDALEAADLLED